ncbi:hypothetical protein GTX14_25045 [Streptomyces sp. SID4944]|nr:hypothetical protein [Streptomyces sp. SID4944]
MLDLRTYRTKMPETHAQADSPAATITGAAQMKWLENTLAGSKDSGTNWRIIGNPVVFAPNFPGVVKYLPGVTQDGILNVDQWDGYRHDRARLLTYLHDHRLDNTVLVTGDIHSAWAFDVPLDQDDPSKNIVASEFVSPSITSDSPWDAFRAKIPAHSAAAATAAMELAKHYFYGVNSHLKFTDLTYHGYGILDVKPEGIEHSWHFIKTESSLIRRSAGRGELLSPAARQVSDRCNELFPAFPR